MFEFNRAKSVANKKKHGISFVAAQKLWEDDNRLVIPAKSTDEIRFALIGKIKDKHWSAFYTLRNDKIRLISVRRSRAEEKELYEGQRY